MIKNIFLPEKIGSYFFFPQRIIGFDIGKTQITATVVHAKGNVRTIERIIHHTLTTTAATYEERVSAGIATICGEVGKYDTIVCGISSSIIFFKELTIPFTQRDKIEKVLPFEIESLLPFPAEQAVLDFIITKIDGSQANIMVGAVQRNQIEEYRALFTQAGVTLTRLVIDLFALYGLYREIPVYRDTQGAVALVNIGFSNSRIAFIHDGQLKYIRSMPKGIGSMLRPITELGIPTAEAHELLLRYGINKNDDAAYSKAAKTGLDDLLSALTFTMQTFLQRLNLQTVATTLLSGGGAEIKDIGHDIAQRLNSKVEVFSADQLFTLPSYRINGQKHISPMAIMSTAIALPTPTMEYSNLLTTAGEEETSLLTKQAIVAGTLVAVILLLLIGNSYWQSRTLSNALSKGQKQVIRTLEAESELKISGVRRVTEAVDTARSRVEEHKKVWGSFASRTRSSFLTYLQKLSVAIDKQAIGLELKKLDINHERITLQGRVRNIPALIILEEELRQANLGTFINPQEPTFNIVITLKKELEECS